MRISPLGILRRTEFRSIERIAESIFQEKCKDKLKEVSMLIKDTKDKKIRATLFLKCLNALAIGIPIIECFGLLELFKQYVYHIMLLSIREKRERELVPPFMFT